MSWSTYWKSVRERMAGNDLTWNEPLGFRRLHYEYEWRGAGWWKRPLAVASVVGGLVAQHFWQLLPGSPGSESHLLLYGALVGAASVVVYGERHLMRWVRSTIKMRASSISRSSMLRKSTWKYEKLDAYQISDNGAFKTLILYPKKGRPVFIGIGNGTSLPKIKVLLRQGKVSERAAALAEKAPPIPG